MFHSSDCIGCTSNPTNCMQRQLCPCPLALPREMKCLCKGTALNPSFELWISLARPSKLNAAANWSRLRFTNHNYTVFRTNLSQLALRKWLPPTLYLQTIAPYEKHTAQVTQAQCTQSQLTPAAEKPKGTYGQVQLRYGALKPLCARHKKKIHTLRMFCDKIVFVIFFFWALNQKASVLNPERVGTCCNTGNYCSQHKKRQ